MYKTLRSLILEKIPFDLRLEIELLSRRRDISNAQKHEELIKLIRKNNLEIVQLGAGTNRYAFRLEGFVVKVATDHDGKIDNWKEFKMAKRLYPYVSKTYEVSSNGTLLVAEYIQPFSSFNEMSIYADKIRSILKQLSSVYLIGDVGITPKNFANWGIRVGTDDPVCLDFAYVYEVSSELFVCRKCKANAMLVPNKDFTELHCTNPSCPNPVTTFEDIRSLIGNDEHRHEIGDLREEGYELFESNTSVLLDEKRSDYLIPSNTKKMKSKKKLINSQTKIKKEDKEMAMGIFKKGTVISGTPEDIHIDKEIRINLVDSDGKEPKVEETEVKKVKKDKPKKEKVAAEAPVEEPTEEAPEDVITGSLIQQPDSSKVEVEVIDEEEKKFSENFKSNSYVALSKFSNRIGRYLRNIDIYSQVSTYLKDKKLYADGFYKGTQNAIYKSLATFMGFKPIQVKNTNNEGTHTEYRLLRDPEGEACEPTITLIERFWNIRAINSIEDDQEAIQCYRLLFRDIAGIQNEWVPVFISTLLTKIPISNSGATLVANAIMNLWGEDCQVVEGSTEEAEETIEAVSSIGEEEAIRILMEADTADKLASEDDPVMEDEEWDDGEDDDEEEEEDEDEEEETYQHLSVCIFEDADENYDIVKIRSADSMGPVNIPFYCKLDQIVVDPSAGGINGMWDWLTYFVPDMMFTTDDPDKYIDFNTLEPNALNFAVIGVNGDEYTIGAYILDGIFINPRGKDVMELVEDEGYIEKINCLVSQLQATSVSHSDRSLTMKGVTFTEEYFINLLNSSDDFNIVEHDDEEEVDEEVDEVEEEEEFEDEDTSNEVEELVDGPAEEAEETEEPTEELKEEEVKASPDLELQRKVLRDSKGRFMKSSDEHLMITPVTKDSITEE